MLGFDAVQPSQCGNDGVLNEVRGLQHSAIGLGQPSVSPAQQVGHTQVKQPRERRVVTRPDPPQQLNRGVRRGFVNR